MAARKTAAEQRSETPKLGFKDGKFHYSTTLRNLDTVPEVPDGTQNLVDTAALNMGYRSTGDVELVATDKDDNGPGGTRTYAVPCKRNTLENFGG